MHESEGEGSVERGAFERSVRRRRSLARPLSRRATKRSIVPSSPLPSVSDLLAEVEGLVKQHPRRLLVLKLTETDATEGEQAVLEQFSQQTVWRGANSQLGPELCQTLGVPQSSGFILFKPPSFKPVDAVPSGCIAALRRAVDRHSRMFAEHCRHSPDFTKRCNSMSVQELLREYESWHREGTDPQAEEEEAAAAAALEAESSLQRSGWRDEVPRFPLVRSSAFSGGSEAGEESADPVIEQHERLRGQWSTVTTKIYYPQGPPVGPGLRGGPRPRIVDVNLRRVEAQRSSALVWRWQ
eukprot:Hpha_TRINITY_DN31601_c0_g1::TRINITY_DN31601_c0_g1_i1::g.29188::m.29188